MLEREELPKKRETLPSRFVYALKGSAKRKPRLVASGHVQFASVLEINFSPTKSLLSSRIFLAGIVDFGLELVGTDFDCLYLHSTLTVQVFILLPQGYGNHVDREAEQRLIWLKKGLYRLKHNDPFWC